MNSDEIKNLDTKELGSKLSKARHELLKVWLAIKSGASKESHLVRNLKKDIARILTLLNIKK